MQGVGDDFVERLGSIHRAFHTDGQRILESILRTAEDMLRDRGGKNVQRSSNPVGDAIACRPVVASHNTDVYIHTEDKVGVKFARSIVEQSEGKLAVCVSIDGPTTFTKNEFQNRSIQFMTCKSLCYNVTQHTLVPKHELVSNPEAFDRNLLPHILDTDPVVQYYHWPVHSIVKIERTFAGNEPVPYFRVIVSANS